MTEQLGVDTSRPPENLPLLDRELTPQEILHCEKACKQYISNDEFEIELQNLNEVNEYFRIFKDQIL